MAHTLTCLLAHVVFSTKERRPWLDEEIRPPLFAYLGGIARESRATLLHVNGVSDHIHLLLLYPPSLALSDLVRLLKTNSSRWLHQKHAATHRLFAWQSGYGGFSVSYSLHKAVAEYIAKQETRHAKKDSGEEYATLLRLHAVEYNVQYFLD